MIFLKFLLGNEKEVIAAIAATSFLFFGCGFAGAKEKKDIAESGTGFVRSEDFVASRKLFSKYHLANFSPIDEPIDGNSQ